MSTIEDFKNAPVGATASLNGSARVWKSRTGETPWATAFHYQWFSSEELAEKGYALERPAPTTASEALELVWELAHEVKEGQVIHKDTRYLETSSYGLKEYTAMRDFEITPKLVPVIRTLEPLPEPEPDWLDAPAVMARVAGWPSCHDPQVFTRENETGTQWVLDTKVYRWDELVGVTPLYPRGQEA